MIKPLLKHGYQHVLECATFPSDLALRCNNPIGGIQFKKQNAQQKASNTGLSAFSTMKHFKQHFTAQVKNKK
jgi:hypothetical protein